MTRANALLEHDIADPTSPDRSAAVAIIDSRHVRNAPVVGSTPVRAIADLKGTWIDKNKAGPDSYRSPNLLMKLG